MSAVPAGRINAVPRAVGHDLRGAAGPRGRAGSRAAGPPTGQDTDELVNGARAVPGDAVGDISDGSVTRERLVRRIAAARFDPDQLGIVRAT